MEVISYMADMTTVMIPWEEIRPIAGAPYGFVTNAIQQRYGFQSVAISPAGHAAGLMTPLFHTGQFSIDDRPVPANHLEFQPTQIVVGSATTDYSIRLLEDVMTFLNSSLGFRKLPKDRKASHVTTIISNFNSSLDTMFGKWAKIKDLLVSLSGSDDPPLLPLGLRFVGFDNERAVPERQFLFERRVPCPPEANWIFSQAPLDTEKHVKLLTTIDQLFGG